MNIDDRLKDAAKRTNSSLAGATIPPLRERRPSRWVSAALAATMVVVVVGAAALLNRGTTVAPTTIPIAPGTTSTTQPTTGATTTTVSSAPTTTAYISIPILSDWKNIVADPSVFGDATITGAVSLDDTIVVTGCATTDGGAGGFPVWTSTDGATWEQASGPSSVGYFEVDCADNLTLTPFGLYATAGALLHSDDGRTWEAVTLPKDNVVAGAIFSTSDRVTALASEAAENESRIATLFTTTDGANWAEGPAASADLFDSSAVSEVLVTNSGLIAVGASPAGEFVPTAAVWTSPDGLNWQKVTDDGAEFADAQMLAAIRTATGFVAVGFDSLGGEMAAWTSSDGVTWHRRFGSGEDIDGSVAHLAATSITQIGDTFYAAGEDADARREVYSIPALWMSNDGATWERVDETDTAIPFNVVIRGSSSIGFWPPPRWVDTQQVQVLISGP